MLITWINKPLVLVIHARQIAEHGGGAELRDDGLLESALARPHQLFAYGNPPPDLSDLAASLAHGITRNQPFVDGNKRTAHVAYRVFLTLNGAELSASEEDKYIAMLELSEGKTTESAFAAWIRQRIQVKQRNVLHQPPAKYKTRTTRRPGAPRPPHTTARKVGAKETR